MFYRYRFGELAIEIVGCMVVCIGVALEVASGSGEFRCSLYCASWGWRGVSCNIESIEILMG